MPAFSHIAHLVVFLLAFSLVSFALPTPSNYSEEGNAFLAPITNPNHVLNLLIDLEGKIKEPMRLITEARTYSEVRAQINVVVVHFEACSNAVLAASKFGKIEESSQVEIASKAASIISIIVQGCLEVSLRLGWFLVFGMFAGIDVCLKMLIANLGACGVGLVALIAKTVAVTCTQLLVSLNFNQSTSVLTISTGL